MSSLNSLFGSSQSSPVSLVSSISEEESGKQTDHRQQLTTAKRLKTYEIESPTSIVIQAPDGRLIQWVVSPTRQGLSVVSNLQSLEELFQFTCYGSQAYTNPQVLQSHFSYLAPPPQSISESSRAILRLTNGKSVFTKYESQSIQRHLQKLNHPKPVDHIAVQRLEPRRWIPFLLKKFFKVTYVPLLHASTFLHRYRRMEDPSRSGIVMAISSITVLNRWYEPDTFGERTLSPKEANRLWEYYAGCAHELAAETFDDISLDALVLHTLLLSFCRILQRWELCVAHANHGLRIGYALQSRYLKIDNSGASPEHVAEFEIETQEWLRCMWSIYSFCIWQIWTKQRPIFSRDELCARIQETPNLKPLPEEPDRTRSMIKNYIYFIDILKKWLIPHDSFTQELLAYVVDNPPYAHIDLCVKVERDVLDWYLQLPVEVRFTETPLKLISVDEFIQQAATQWELEAIVDFWTIWILFHFRYLPNEIGNLEAPISAQDQFLYNSLETTIIAAKNILNGLIYMIDHVKDHPSIHCLHLVCEVNWVIANIGGLDKRRVRSAKQDVLKSIFIIDTYFRQLNISNTELIHRTFQFDGHEAESFFKLFAKDPQLVGFEQKERGFSVAEREQRRFLEMLKNKDIQDVLQSFANDLRVS